MTNKDGYLNNITNFINNDFFCRSESRTGHWPFPFAIADNNLISDISISGKDTSKYYNNHKGLVNVALNNKKTKNIWKIFISKYIKIKKIMKKDLTDEEIDELDNLVNEWFDKIIENFGMQMTNYVYMLGAGNISYFLIKYRNLCRYNQQGWEGLNFKITELFFYY